MKGDFKKGWYVFKEDVQVEGVSGGLSFAKKGDMCLLDPKYWQHQEIYKCTTQEEKANLETISLHFR